MPSSTAMPPEDIRRWVEARRAAADREVQEARAHGYVADPVAAALSLIALAGRLHGWPPREDPVSRREDERVRETWDRLRRALSSS